ncbi:MAG: replication initiator protein [Microvirus sp.]|nr:MAG: replication initiator protein [Microvirus sp.]
MRCYHPLKAFRTSSGVSFSELARDDHVGDIELPCGQCIGCRERRASEWTLRVMHEATCHDTSCFVTLTYSPEHLPPGGTLDHRHFQLFMKRLRKRFGPSRFYMCGEYGPLDSRPHYHAVLFGVDFRSTWRHAGKSRSGSIFYSSSTLTSLWGLGICSVQPLTRETAGYCARYILKKQLGRNASYDLVDSDGVVTPRRPEYAAMSLKPGIGAEWFHKFSSDVLSGDSVVADGAEKRVPRYYDKLSKRMGVEADLVAMQRAERGRRTVEDSTPERLAVRERVHLARISNHLKRGS